MMTFLRVVTSAAFFATSVSAAPVTPEKFQPATQLSVDGGYDAVALAKVANILIKAGFDEQETVSSISKLVLDRIPAEDLPDMISAAAMLSSVNGQSLARTSSRLSRVFRGDVADIRKLDAEYNFLTADQYEKVRSENIVSARRIALAALVARLDKATN